MKRKSDPMECPNCEKGRDPSELVDGDKCPGCGKQLLFYAGPSRGCTAEILAEERAEAKTEEEQDVYRTLLHLFACDLVSPEDVADFIYFGRTSEDRITTKVEAANDPAKELGTLETWNGQDVYVVWTAKGHFLTWRKVKPAEADSTPVAVADGGQDEIAFTTNGGADVAVTADDGTLFVDADGDDFAFETSAQLTTARGMDVLYCGRQRDDSGTKFQAYIPVGEHKEEIEELRKESESERTDEPLAYEVTETTRKGGWGQEITKQKLRATKLRGEMTEKERELNRKVNKKYDVPDDAEAGDVVALEDILDDTRTREEKDQDALEEASETDEEVLISKSMTDCNDASKECDLDHVTRVATPEGDIEIRRTHTY